MVSFTEKNNTIVFAYSEDVNPDKNWMADAFSKEESINYKRTFHFRKQDIHKLPGTDSDDHDDMDPEAIAFVFAKREGDYFKVVRGILDQDYDIYIHQEVNFSINLFVANNNISIVGEILKLTKSNLYIGGHASNAVPSKAYKALLSKFPNSYEKRLYAAARISSIIRQYVETPIDHEKQFDKYLNRKSTQKGNDLIRVFKDIDELRYLTILGKMEDMLSKEVEYNEKQWQEEILQIILILYPKYIAAFREVPVKVQTTKFLDYMLVDASGHVDIIEIKKPNDNSIITKSLYRDNYIPLRELSGTIMQIEKYIYFLNRSAAKVEAELTEKYSGKLPLGLSIKVTNPSGIIIMGRQHTLSPEQMMDFEVVKRKYKNVIDIITYDDLLQRLRFTIEQIRKL